MSEAGVSWLCPSPSPAPPAPPRAWTARLSLLISKHKPPVPTPFHPQGPVTSAAPPRGEWGPVMGSEGAAVTKTEWGGKRSSRREGLASSGNSQCKGPEAPRVTRAGG